MGKAAVCDGGRNLKVHTPGQGRELKRCGSIGQLLPPASSADQSLHGLLRVGADRKLTI